MSNMYLNSGRMIDPLHIENYDFSIAELIHPICMLARYGGQTVAPYYVGEHTCHLYDKVPAPLRRVALLHDMSESIMVDMPRPIKNELPQYTELEDRIQRHLFRLFKEPMENMEALKYYDNTICNDEMEQVFAVPFRRQKPYDSLGVVVRFWNWQRTKRELTVRCTREGLL